MHTSSWPSGMQDIKIGLSMILGQEDEAEASSILGQFD